MFFTSQPTHSTGKSFAPSVSTQKFLSALVSSLSLLPGQVPSRSSQTLHMIRMPWATFTNKRPEVGQSQDLLEISLQSTKIFVPEKALLVSPCVENLKASSTRFIFTARGVL